MNPTAIPPAEVSKESPRKTPILTTSFYEDLEPVAAAAESRPAPDVPPEPFYITDPVPSRGAEPTVPPDAFPGIPAPTGTPVAHPEKPPVSRTAVRMLESRIRTQTETVNDTLDDIVSERSLGLSTLPLCFIAAGIAWGSLWYYGAPQQLAVMITGAVFAFALLINLIVSLSVSSGRMRRLAVQEFGPEMDKLEALYEELYSARTGRPLNYAGTLLELRRSVQKGKYKLLLPAKILYDDEK